uniref:Uncharacterized protein n=1 Tax=Arundo donax TaxID=35708 RepID=A0A0A8YST0_ARUDO
MQNGQGVLIGHGAGTGKRSILNCCLATWRFGLR